MKKWTACLLLIVPFLLTASPIIVKTPPKLETFILENIGSENFFQGTNKAVKSIEIRKNKDSLYYPFDLYKSVSMGLGVPFDSAHTTHHYRLDQQNYYLTLRLETAHNSTTNFKNSIIILIFTQQ